MGRCKVSYQNLKMSFSKRAKKLREFKHAVLKMKKSFDTTTTTTTKYILRFRYKTIKCPPLRFTYSPMGLYRKFAYSHMGLNRIRSITNVF